MEPMARRRMSRQDPDAVDEELARAMQAVDGSSTPVKSGHSATGKAKKVLKKAREDQAKDGDRKDSQSDIKDPNAGSSGAVVPEGPEASRPEESERPAESDGPAGTPEEMQSPESVAAHPFWSDKAKLEVALAKARPPTLDHEALRFAHEGDGVERPIDLEERAQRQREVKLDEEYLEPSYDSPPTGPRHGATSSATEDVLQKFEIDKAKLASSNQVLSGVQLSEAGPSVEPVHSSLISSHVGDQMEDQALEIAQLRSLVDHLQGALLQAEEARSFTSSSNHGHELHQSVSTQLEAAKTGLSRVGLECRNAGELGSLNVFSSVSSPQPPVGPAFEAWMTQAYPNPPALPVPRACQPAPPKPPVSVSMPVSVSQRGIPEVFPISSRATVDPFTETVLVHGQPHRWVRLGDKLGLEPVQTSRQRSPSPPPPKTTPPPSPPPYVSSPDGWMPSISAPGEPSSQALVLVPGQDWSSQALGDQDGGGSGVHSYQSAESGEVKGHREGYPQLCPATSPSFNGQGEPKNAGSGLFGVDKQSILYHLNQVKMGKLTIDQLASALGAESMLPPGHSLLAQPSTSGLSAERMGLQGLGACCPSMSGVGAMPTEAQDPCTVYPGIQGSGAEHQGRQGLGAEHVGLQGLGAIQTNGLGLGAGCDAQGALPSGLGALSARPQGASQVTGVPSAARLGQGAFQVADVPGAAHLGQGAFQVADVPGAAHLGQGAFQVADVPGAAHSGQGAYPAPGVQGMVHTGSSVHQVAGLQGTAHAGLASAQAAGMQSVPQLGQGAFSVGVHNAAQVGPGALPVTGPQGAAPLGHGTSRASLLHSPQLGPSSVLGGSSISMAGLPASSQAASGIGLAIQAPVMFAGHGTQEGIQGSSVPGTSLPPNPPNTGHRESSWFNSGSTPRGKGEFEPGDRVFWELPKLGPVTEANAAVRASDWLYRSALMLRDLSSKSWLWWDKVYEAALKFYHDYQQSDPLTRGQIRPDLPEDLQHHTFARLESRAVSMLLQAVPESVSSQALATRSLSTVGLLFQILKQFQPGGLSERQELLKSLTDLSPSSHPSDAVLVLQSWFRHIARARAMQVQLPDGSLLLAALDAMAKPLLAENAQVAFRVSLNRHQLRLDYRAEIELVEAYARNLMAEFEVLSLASDPASPPKRPRVKKVREKASAPASPPKDSSPAPLSPAAPPLPKPPPAKAPMSNKPCTSWLTDAGCKYGSKCRFVHDMEAEALKGRCFACSAKDHWANNCPVKQAERQGDPSQGKAKGFPARKGEGKGKSTAGVKALDGSSQSTLEPPNVSSTEPPASSNKAVILDNSTPTADLAREVTEVLRSLRLKKIGAVQTELGIGIVFKHCRSPKKG